MDKSLKIAILGLVFIPVILIAIPLISHTIVQNSERTVFLVDGENLHVNGLLTNKTPIQLKNIIAENPHIDTLRLGKIPGTVSVISTFDMGYWIREQGLNTHIASNSTIASGGVWLFLAGNNRTMIDGAKIGVHAYGNNRLGLDGKDLDKYDFLHENAVKYVQDMLDDDKFYWFTNSFSHSEIHDMTNDEVLQYRLLTVPILNNSTELR